LPSVITFADGNTINYGYDATGSKLSVAYTAGGTTTKTEYAGNKVYKNGTLSMILTEEGYVTLSGTTPTYHYYLKDHQDNNRVVLNQSGTVEQVNHYYPFGGLFGEGLQAVNQPYRYNGKELDRELGLDMYDYSARNYDAALGRWLSVDPMAEKYYSISPYVYVANNPVRFIDPEGMRLDDIIIREKEKTVTIVQQNENVDRIFDKNNPQGKEIEKGSFDLDKYSDVGYSIETLSSVGMGMTDFVASSVMGGVILSKVGGLISKGISALKAGQGTNTVRATAKIGTNASKGSTALAPKYPADAAIAGTTERTFLMQGQVIDRYGALGGKWFSTPGTSYGARSIPPGLSPYTQFKVLKPFEVQKSLASPGFFGGQTGFGIQFQSPVGADVLIKRGIIAPF